MPDGSRRPTVWEDHVRHDVGIAPVAYGAARQFLDLIYRHQRRPLGGQDCARPAGLEAHPMQFDVADVVLPEAAQGDLSSRVLLQQPGHGR
jgi:hypothetical protein